MATQHLNKLSAIPLSVSQGSILKPPSFLIYINNLPNVYTVSPIMFADDTKMVLSYSNFSDSVMSLIKEANSGLYGYAEWFRANELSLNIRKQIKSNYF